MKSIRRGFLLVAIGCGLCAAGCSRGECACQRYELVNTNQGLYKLDKQTGQVWFIEGQYTYEVFSAAETGELVRDGKVHPLPKR
jgi:hypothetical protein